MGILRIDHPDILDFIALKQTPTEMTNFNLSVGITDSFMQALARRRTYALINPLTNTPARRLPASVVFDRLVEAAPTYFISGSSLHAWWLRALGARIGRDVNIGSITLRAPDLLSVGDGASIGNAVNLENARVLQGELLLGPITLAAESHVGSYAVLEGNTRLGEWSHLDAQSALSDGQSVPDRRLYSGSPARDAGPFDPSSLQPRLVAGRVRLAGEAVFFFLGALLIATLFFLPVFPTFMLIDKLDNIAEFPWMEVTSPWLSLFKYFVLALPASGVMIVCTALLSAGIRWSILPGSRAGAGRCTAMSIAANGW